MKRWTCRKYHRERCPRWARKCAVRWQALAALWWRRAAYARDRGLLDLAREYQHEARGAYWAARWAMASWPVSAREVAP